MKTLFAFLLLILLAPAPARALDVACTTTPNLGMARCPELSEDWYESYTDQIDELDSLAVTAKSTFTVAGNSLGVGRAGSGFRFKVVAGTATAAQFVGPLVGDVTGNVSGSAGSATGNSGTATALAADPSDAASGFVCRGINASGTCQPAWVETAATSVSTNPISSGAAYTALAAKAPLNSPQFTGSPAGLPYDISGQSPSAPTASYEMIKVVMVRSVSFASAFALSKATASVSATAYTTFNVNKNASSIGTFYFSTGGSSGTYTGAGGSFAAGDILTVTAPSSPDATLSGISFNLAGTTQ